MLEAGDEWPRLRLRVARADLLQRDLQDAAPLPLADESRTARHPGEVSRNDCDSTGGCVLVEHGDRRGDARARPAALAKAAREAPSLTRADEGQPVTRRPPAE